MAWDKGPLGQGSSERGHYSWFHFLQVSIVSVLPSTLGGCFVVDKAASPLCLALPARLALLSLSQSSETENI